MSEAAKPYSAEQVENAREYLRDPDEDASWGPDELRHWIATLDAKAAEYEAASKACERLMRERDEARESAAIVIEQSVNDRVHAAEAERDDAVALLREARQYVEGPHYMDDGVEIDEDIVASTSGALLARIDAALAGGKDVGSSGLVTASGSDAAGDEPGPGESSSTPPVCPTCYGDLMPDREIDMGECHRCDEDNQDDERGPA